MNTATGELIGELTAIVGQQQVKTEQADLWSYGYDNSKLHALPDCIVFPDSTEQVAQIIKTCNQLKIPLIARGRGTGTTGATVPTNGGVILSTEHMNQIIRFDAANRYIVVQPGVTNQAVQDEAKQKNFFWPPDPTSSAFCTIGGNLAYNSAGPRAVKYGTPRENTLGLVAVTGEGDIIRCGVNTTKGVVGYDLTRLIIGSEGTLAIITEATLKLTPLAPDKTTIKALYNSIESAALAVSSIMSQDTIPCALEFMDSSALNIVRNNSDIVLPADANAMLMIEVDGKTENLRQMTADIKQAASNEGTIDFVIASSNEEIQSLWATRKALSPGLRKIAPKKINEDVVVPVSNIPALISGLESISQQYQIPIVNFGHAGNGNIHVNLLVDPDIAEQKQNMDSCLQSVFDLVLKLDGTLSGEHGVGLAKLQYINQELDQNSIELMHRIKQQFDPNNILNPGKTIPTL